MPTCAEHIEVSAMQDKILNYARPQRLDVMAGRQKSPVFLDYLMQANILTNLIYNKKKKIILSLVVVGEINYCFIVC